MKYKITVALDRKDEESKYANYDTVYEQIIEDDGRIVNAVVMTVVNHSENTYIEPTGPITLD